MTPWTRDTNVSFCARKGAEVAIESGSSFALLSTEKASRIISKRAKICFNRTFAGWRAELLYMSNVSSPFSSLNILFQCFCTNIFIVRNQTDALRKKPALWMVVYKKGMLQYRECYHHFEILTTVDVNTKFIFNIIS